MSKRKRQTIVAKQEEEEEEEGVPFILLDDVLQCILIVPIQRFIVSTYTHKESLVDLLGLPLVSHQWHRIFVFLLKTLEFSWLERIKHFDHQISRHHFFMSLEAKAGTNIDELIQKAKTIQYCIERTVQIRDAIDLFREKHNIVYHTPKGKIYRNYVGIRKLAKIKIGSQAVRVEYQALIKLYNKYHKRHLMLNRQLANWFQSRPVMRYVSIRNGSFVLPNGELV